MVVIPMTMIEYNKHVRIKSHVCEDCGTIHYGWRGSLECDTCIHGNLLTMIGAMKDGSIILTDAPPYHRPPVREVGS
jgi:hypothetical protein